MLEHQNVVRGDIQVRRVNTVGHVFEVFKDNCATFMLHQLRVRSGLLNNCTARGKVALQNSDTTLRIDGVLGCPDHVLFKTRTRCLNLFAERAASDCQRIEVQQRLEFTQQRSHAARVVEVFHVVLTRGLQIKQYGGFPAHAIKCFEIHLKAHTACNRS